MHMHIYVHMCMYPCTPHPTLPTHLHGVLQVPSGCTEAVEGVDPPTTRGHHTHYRVTSTALVRLESTHNLNEWIVGRITAYTLLWVSHTHNTLAYYVYMYVH